MVNPLLWRPAKLFVKAAEIMISTYKGVVQGDWLGFAWGFAQKGVDNPNLFGDLRKDWVGAVEDISMIMDDLRIQHAKPVQLVDNMGNPIQFDPEQRLSDDGRNFTYNEETGETEFHAIEVEVEQMDMGLDIENEYVEKEFKQQEMDLEKESVEVEIVQQEMEFEYGIS